MPLRMLNYVVQFWQSLQSGKADTLPAVFPIVLYNGDPKWNAATEILECIQKVGIPEKYLPKMSYYLIDISKIEKLAEMDTLVASVVYAEQHSEDNLRKDYIEKLGHLAKEIVPGRLTGNVFELVCDYFYRYNAQRKDFANARYIEGKRWKYVGNSWRTDIQRRPGRRH